MIIKKTKTVTQTWNKDVSRCSMFTETTRIYFCKMCIYSFVDIFNESVIKQDSNTNIGFNK